MLENDRSEASGRRKMLENARSDAHGAERIIEKEIEKEFEKEFRSHVLEDASLNEASLRAFNARVHTSIFIKYETFVKFTRAPANAPNGNILDGMLTKFGWNAHGIWMEYGWNMNGICIESGGNMDGIWMEC